MNYLKDIKNFLQGRNLLLLTTLMLSAFTFAQSTTPCRADFDFKIDQNTKTIKLEAKSNQSPAVFGFDLGDGTFLRGQQVSHTYSAAGEYKVGLTVIAFNSSTNQRCTTKVYKKVKIVDCDRLKIGFVFEVEGLVVKVKGRTNSNNVSTGFKFGDGSGKRGLEAKHRYSKPGVYKVCFIAEDSTYGCRQEVCQRVVVGKNTCDLEADFKFETKGLGVKVKARANQKNVHFYWAFGNGNDASGATAGSRYKKPGVYEVCLIAFNQKTKCKTMVCKRVLITKPCNLKADFKIRKAQDKVLVKVRTNASTKTLYTYDFGDGSAKVTTRSKGARHTYTKKGLYTISVVVSDKRRGCRTLVEHKVRIGGRDNNNLNLEAVAEETNNIASEQPIEVEPSWAAKASPSPARTNISFDSVDKNLASVKVLDLKGTTVIEQNTNYENLDISVLPKGFYYAHITAADGTSTVVKFLKD